MVKFESVLFVAAFAISWFNNFALLDKAAFLTVAVLASEGGLLHLWDDVRAADHDTTQGHQLLDVVRVQLSDSVHFLQVEWSNLDHDFIELVVLVLLASRVLTKATTWLSDLLLVSHTDLSVQVHFPVH